MTAKVITWIAISVSVIALGLSVYFLVTNQAATSTTPPCTVGQDPNCEPPKQPTLVAAVYCGYTDGRPEEVLTSLKDCESDPYWSYREFYPNRNGRVENPNPQLPEEPAETDPQEIGACFIDYKPLPIPPPANQQYSYYIDTFASCLGDPDAYAFCVDENATSPEGCEFISELPGGEGTQPL